MLLIRRAKKSDNHALHKILDEADLHYSNQKLDDFRVAEMDGTIVGLVRLEEHEDFFFLTSLGVAGDQRNKGIASAILKNIFAEAHKPIYLYTIIPDFFKKFGFTVTDSHPRLPPKEVFGCDQCRPGSCFVMVKGPHGT